MARVNLGAHVAGGIPAYPSEAQVAAEQAYQLGEAWRHKALDVTPLDAVLTGDNLAFTQELMRWGADNHHAGAVGFLANRSVRYDVRGRTRQETINADMWGYPVGVLATKQAAGKVPFKVEQVFACFDRVPEDGTKPKGKRLTPVWSLLVGTSDGVEGKITGAIPRDRDGLLQQITVGGIQRVPRRWWFGVKTIFTPQPLREAYASMTFDPAKPHGK